jgi:hypothetical protein
MIVSIATTPAAAAVPKEHAPEAEKVGAENAHAPVKSHAEVIAVPSTMVFGSFRSTASPTTGSSDLMPLTMLPAASRPTTVLHATGGPAASSVIFIAPLKTMDDPGVFADKCTSRGVALIFGFPPGAVGGIADEKLIYIYMRNKQNYQNYMLYASHSFRAH